MRTSTARDGFTLVEVLVVIAVIAILAGVSVPQIGGLMRRYALNSATRQVASVIRSSRYTAVSKNRIVRVRFNCPAAGQFRVVEVVGSAAVDNDVNRCSETNYGYPDPDTAAAPDVDGPIHRLPSDAQFVGVQDIQFDTQGRAQRLIGCPACVAAAAPATVVTGNGYETQTLTISASGQVLAQ